MAEPYRQPPRVTTLRNLAPIRSPSSEPVPDRRSSPAVKFETSGKETPTRPGASYPAVKVSNIDIDTKPLYEPIGKPITEVDMDAGTIAMLYTSHRALKSATQIFLRMINLGGGQVQT